MTAGGRGMVASVLVCVAANALAANPVGWRNDGSGVYPDARPPTRWAANSNVLWSTQLPSWGNASPVVVGDRVLIGCEPTLLLCLSAADGRILWVATNSYFDAIPPAGLEPAREMQRQADALRKEAGALDQECNKLQSRFNELNALRKTSDELKAKLALIGSPELCAAKVAELKTQAAEIAAQREKEPDNRGLKRKAEQVEDDLKLLQSEALLNERLEATAARLAQQEPEEAALKEKAASLRKQAETIRREKLAALDRYDMPSTHANNGYSTATAVSDGAAIYVVRGNGMAACYEPDGKRRWIRFVHKPTHGWGHSASPVLAGGCLVVQWKHMVGLDAATGETRWEAPQAEASFGTPAVTSIGGEAVVVTAKGDVVRAADGKVLAGRLSKLEYAAPVVSGAVAYFLERGGKAIRLPAAIGDAFSPETLWTASGIEGDRYYASAVVLDGLIYAVNQQSGFSCVDAATGAPVYSRKLALGATVYSSVTCAGGLLYVSAENGVTAVLKTGREFAEVARNTLEPFRACPVFDGNRLYIRGMKRLYCIATSSP